MEQITEQQKAHAKKHLIYYSNKKKKVKAFIKNIETNMDTYNILGKCQGLRYKYVKKNSILNEEEQRLLNHISRAGRELDRIYNECENGI